MKNPACILILLMIFFLPACSNGDSNPISSQSEDLTGNLNITVDALTMQNASDVLYSHSSRNPYAYKAFGVYFVEVDLAHLTAEIVPARTAHAIGDTFDADLTQFLTVSPCPNCLMINGIDLIGTDQVQVGFAVKHPFDDIIARPDLHGFDVRGIVIANGNYNFPQTFIVEGVTSFIPARANVNLVVNPDGFTHHFDNLAADANYFDPPRDYDANINPFKNYFVDGSSDAFDPHVPQGYNVMETGAEWETQNYIFSMDNPGVPLDFVFVVDCAYGQSATFLNRDNPYYFLPEFNRKEAWKVNTTIISNGLLSADTGSSAQISVEVCDWQAGFSVDSDYPDIENPDGISSASDVDQVSIEITNVSVLVQSDTPDSGNGSESDPYVFNLNVKNDMGVPAGWYYGIVAVRDDLQGQQGPAAIPETPSGFPYPGPEIYDYSVYDIFKIRVNGSPPSITGWGYPSNPDEGEIVYFNVDTSEPDGDDVTYQWEQIAPVSPVGIFEDPTIEDAVWQAPDLWDIPPPGIDFTLRITVTDIDGSDSEDFNMRVDEINVPPVCDGIFTNPYYGVFSRPDDIDIRVEAHDPENRNLYYEWDLNWDGRVSNFSTDATGENVDDVFWMDQGFYNAACRITEERTNPQQTICSRWIIQEGLSNDVIKIDTSPDANPGYQYQDIVMIPDANGNPVYHITWLCNLDRNIHYCNNAYDPMVFGNYEILSTGPSSGFVYDTRIAGQGDIIHVVWKEQDTSSVPNDYALMVNTSLDGGLTFGAMGGQRAIVDFFTNDVLYNADICTGAQVGQFYVMFLYGTGGGNHYGEVMVSNDGGLTWDFPNGVSGIFRDLTSADTLSCSTIEVSANGVIHTFWSDAWIIPSAYFYDWSVDGGITWNADIQISDSSHAVFGAMSVSDNGDAFFTWADGIESNMYFRKTTFALPPVLGSKHVFFSYAPAAIHGVDIWASPAGNTVIIPLTFDSPAGYYNRYYYSYDDGASLNYYFTRYFGFTPVYRIFCDGKWDVDPNRAEIMTTWVDTRTGIEPAAHIYGDYLYLAERF